MLGFSFLGRSFLLINRPYDEESLTPNDEGMGNPTGKKYLQGNQAMQNLIIIAAVLAGWLILNLWILPKFGVST